MRLPGWEYRALYQQNADLAEQRDQLRAANREALALLELDGHTHDCHEMGCRPCAAAAVLRDALAVPA